MGRMIDDSVKQKLLDSLAKEPTMVLSTAYAYAKNYALYGEDITKEWTTAVQQASIIEKVSLDARVQAYETFKREYENRLKADMVAMLTELYMEIEELDNPLDYDFEGYDTCVVDCEKLIQQKINSLKENTDGKIDG